MEQHEQRQDDGREMWAGFASALMRAARDVATLACLNEPVVVDIAPEDRAAEWIVTILPAESLVRVYLAIPAPAGEPRRMAHCGDLLMDGTWRSGAVPIQPDGPAH